MALNPFAKVAIRPDVGTIVSFPWTRVPKGDPPLDALQRRLLPVADLFMGLMWSRPGGLSLRNTWVTPVTMWLAASTGLLAGPPGLAAIAYGIGARQLLFVVVGLLGAALATGAGAVAIYGIRQPRLSRNGIPRR